MKFNSVSPKTGVGVGIFPKCIPLPKFGSAKNFSGQTGERALKSIIKDHAQRTQQRADKFAEQCAIQEYEDKVIDYVYNDISGKLGMNCKNEGNDSFCKYKVEGEFTVHLENQMLKDEGLLELGGKTRNK